MTKQNNQNNSIPHVLVIFFALLAILFQSACDNNIVRPEKLAAESVNVSAFTVDKPVLSVGESTILRWTADDPDGKVDYGFISGEGQVASNGTKQVTPKKTTIYTLTLYAGNKAVAKQSLQITVLSPSGDEITTDPEDEICNDKIDNDGDGAIDCFDEDCAEDEACVEPSKNYTFSYIVEPENPNVGDEVTITWESNYKDITIVGLSGRFFEGNDSYTFVAEATESTEGLTEPQVFANKVIINLFTDEGLRGGTKEVDVPVLFTPAPADPVYSASGNFVVTDNSGELRTEFLYGMSYTINWNIQNASEVLAKINDGDFLPYLSSEEIVVSSAQDNREYTFYITDTAAEETRVDRKSIKVRAFEDYVYGPQLPGTIVDIVPTRQPGTYYFFTSDKKIYRTGDWGQNIYQVVIGMNNVVGDMTAMTVSPDGTVIVIATNNSIYVSESEADFVRVYGLGTQTVSALHYASATKILIGTNRFLFRSQKIAAGDCSYGHYQNGYCTNLYQMLGRAPVYDDWNDRPVNFKKFIPDLSNAESFIAVTSVGTYKINDGLTFDASNMIGLNAEPKGGFLSVDNDWILWASNRVWTASRGSTNFSAVNLGTSALASSQIFGAVKISSDWLFVASSDGLYFRKANEWKRSNLSATRLNGSIQFLINAHDLQKVVEEDELTQKRQLNVITTTGQGYKAVWYNSMEDMVDTVLHIQQDIQGE